MSKDASLSGRIWGRRYDHAESTISRQLYMLYICGWTFVGLMFSTAMSFISQDWPVDTWNAWAYLGFALAVLVTSIIGTSIANASSNVFVSAIGYALVAGPFGLLLGPFMAMYQTSSVVKVFALTSFMVLALGLVGAILPGDLSSWGTWLFGGLVVLIGGYFIVPLLGFLGVPVEGAMTILDWAGVLLFGGLIIYDLNKAVRLPHTPDNAVDSAVAIYLDFINIFIRLLSLTGQEK